jgi:hypothetical protein
MPIGDSRIVSVSGCGCCSAACDGCPDGCEPAEAICLRVRLIGLLGDDVFIRVPFAGRTCSGETFVDRYFLAYWPADVYRASPAAHLTGCQVELQLKCSAGGYGLLFILRLYDDDGVVQAVLWNDYLFSCAPAGLDPFTRDADCGDFTETYPGSGLRLLIGAAGNPDLFFGYLGSCTSGPLSPAGNWSYGPLWEDPAADPPEYLFSGFVELSLSGECTPTEPPDPVDPPTTMPEYCVWCEDWYRECSTLASETPAEICAAHGGVKFVGSQTEGCGDCEPITHCYACADDGKFGVYYWPPDNSYTDPCASHGGVVARWPLGEDGSSCIFCEDEDTPLDTGAGTYTGPYGTTTPNDDWDTTGPASWLGSGTVGVAPGTYTWTFSITAGAAAGYRLKVWADDVCTVYVGGSPIGTTHSGFLAPTEMYFNVGAGTHTVTFEVTNTAGGDSAMGLKVEWVDCDTPMESLVMSDFAPEAPAPAARVSLPVARPKKCPHLGKRTEFRAGCSGWMCGHDCDLGHPAVPGGYCQSCPDYEADG